VLAEQNAIPTAAQEYAAAVELIIKLMAVIFQFRPKKRFEALSAIVYRPENLHAVDQHHRQIINKTCVVSARDDNLQTIKIYLINAALKQGMSPETKVTGLADGANNCWSVLSIIKPECSTLECVLDWFHIGKRFQNVKTALGDAFANVLTAPNRSFGMVKPRML